VPRTNERGAVSEATLAINSRNYGAWSLRGWLMCRFAGLEFTERVLGAHDPGARAELLLLSPSFLVPNLEVDGLSVWDTLAIGEYLWETIPDSGLLPSDPADRARCRSVCGEMHAGFAAVRSALPMNIKSRHPGFKVFSGAQADIDRIVAIWQDCLTRSGGPLLFGTTPTMADAMYAPVCTRFVTYDVDLPDDCAAYVERVMHLPDMAEWIAAVQQEPDTLEELDVDVEF
jgi:glutathione S-transferase